MAKIMTNRKELHKEWSERHEKWLAKKEVRRRQAQDEGLIFTDSDSEFEPEPDQPQSIQYVSLVQTL